MHIYRALAALALVQSFFFVTAAPLTASPISSILITDTEPQRSSDQALTLIPSSPNEDSSAPRPPSSFGSPSKANTSLVSPQGLIPYRVKGSPTTLLFHGFGVKIPSKYMLRSLSLSLRVVLSLTLDGKGRDLISNGFFINTHVLPNGNNLTITVADFRENGKPMVYDTLRDVLSGIGDFMTEPDEGVTTLSYEVDVDGMGYVGTGHVGYATGGD